MNVATVRRPMGCIKAALRQTRQQRTTTRSLATAAAAADAGTPQPRSVFSARQRPYPPRPPARHPR